MPVKRIKKLFAVNVDPHPILVSLWYGLVNCDSCCVLLRLRGRPLLLLKMLLLLPKLLLVELKLPPELLPKLPLELLLLPPEDGLL